MDVRICVGSSCHIKESPTIVKMFQEAVAQYRLEDKVTLTGSFCTGHCNRIGVTVSIDGTVFTGIIPETFSDFFRRNILCKFPDRASLTA